MCVLITILLYGYKVDINQRIGTSIGDECEVLILKTMFCSYSNKTTLMFTWIIFLREGRGGVNNCIENNGVAFSIKRGLHIFGTLGERKFW